MLLSSRDANNRPKPFKSGAKKFEGNANSLRILSRVITLILSPIIEQSCTEKYLIKLHEVGEIITAPDLSITEIDTVMAPINSDYLDLRADAVMLLGMPKPRPKHHFISHYCSLFKSVGPLINVWAMRLESKHAYFKEVTRTARTSRISL